MTNTTTPRKSLSGEEQKLVTFTILAVCKVFNLKLDPDFAWAEARTVILDTFNRTHSELLKVHKTRFRAEDELLSLIKSSKSTPSKIQAKEEEVKVLRSNWDIHHWEFLEARRWEELTRSLGSALDTWTDFHTFVDDVERTASWSPQNDFIRKLGSIAKAVKSNGVK